MLNIHKNTFLYRVEGIGLYHESKTFRSLENALICMLDFMADGYTQVEFGTVQVSDYVETYTPIQLWKSYGCYEISKQNEMGKAIGINTEFELWFTFSSSSYGYMPTKGHDEMTDEFYYKSVKKD